jgi:hypothetical protein
VYWLGAVGIPYLALLTLAVIEGRGASKTFSDRFLELGIDACILGIGITGALFASREVKAKFGDYATMAALVLMFVDLIIAGFCLHLRNFDRFTPAWKARVSIFLGTLILTINTSIVWGAA